jgi:hypothetical protein
MSGLYCVTLAGGTKFHEFKRCVEDMVWDDVDCIRLVQDRILLLGNVNVVTELRIF